MKELLGSVAEDTDNTEHQFKLRTALQLLEVIEKRQDVASKALKEAEIGEETRENLRELGYLS